MNLMKIILAMSLLVQVSIVQAMWVITKIDNQSDLTFMQAARGDNDTEIASISQFLKNPIKSAKSQIINLQADALFGSSGGCKIIAQNPAGEKIAISFKRFNLLLLVLHVRPPTKIFLHSCEVSRC